VHEALQYLSLTGQLNISSPLELKYMQLLLLFDAELQLFGHGLFASVQTLSTHDCDKQVSPLLHEVPTRDSVDSFAHAIFASPGTPIYPDKHEPQVFSVVRQSYLFRDAHAFDTVQSTEFMYSVAALTTWLTVDGSFKVKADDRLALTNDDSVFTSGIGFTLTVVDVSANPA
jgi:hypothetical protein